MAGEEVQFEVFISYSHAVDRAVAAALQSKLQVYAKKWNQYHALRVFRDDTNLAAESNLTGAIERYLDASAWLVLLASPDAAVSRWVNEEVSWWLNNKRPESLLVVLTEGELENALPPALREAELPVPRWVDLRGLHDKDLVDKEDRRLQNAVVDLASTIRNIPRDQLEGEHLRRVQQTRRIRRVSLLTVALLFVGVAVASVVAFIQSENAADRQRLATARMLLTQADAARTTDARTALLLGETAYHVYPGPETRSGLDRTLLSNRYRATLSGHTNFVDAAAFSPDSHTLATGGYDGTVILWDLAERSNPRRGPNTTSQR